MLIVAPSFLRFIWHQEILRWLRHPAGIREKDVQIIVSSKDHWRPSALIYIMSYDLASKMGEDLETLKFKVCIADEAHYLKSRDSKRSVTLLPILT